MSNIKSNIKSKADLALEFAKQRQEWKENPEKPALALLPAIKWIKP